MFNKSIERNPILSLMGFCIFYVKTSPLYGMTELNNHLIYSNMCSLLHPLISPHDFKQNFILYVLTLSNTIVTVLMQLDDSTLPRDIFLYYI